MSTVSSSILMAHHWKTWDWQERLLDYSRTIGIATNVVAELCTFRDGLKLCTQLHLLAVEVELDKSLILLLISGN